jgi:hypothetical protein
MNETFKEEGIKTLKDIIAYIRCENEWNLSCCLKCIKGECNEIANSSNFNSIVVDNRVNVSKKNEQKDEQEDEHVKKDEYVKSDSVHSNTSF